MRDPRIVGDAPRVEVTIAGGIRPTTQIPPTCDCNVPRCVVEPTALGHLISCPSGRWLVDQQGQNHRPEDPC